MILIQGPYPAGKYNAVTIFQGCLKGHLDLYDRVVADKEYVGEDPQFVKCPNSKMLQKELQRMIQQESVHNETMDAWFKFWGILKQVYRHNIDHHGNVISALGVIIQLSVENGKPLYSVDYDDIK